jgi:membrane associated rhomboid family serine protease
MLFLYVFGDNVEDALGPGRYVVFYIICGLAAAAAQIMTNAASPLPMVGASGAIGGIMGAYGRLYPHARVHTLLFFGFFITTVSLPAIAMLGYWFVFQLIAGLPSLSGAAGGVAFWAHVGGFACGFLLAPLFRPPQKEWA